jgi:retinol dehydrogenase-12
MSLSFVPPPQNGRSFVITGANTGIGRATAEALARAGAHVTIACRTVSKGEEVAAAIRAEGKGTVDVVALDLGDLAQTRACADALLERDRPIHGLINNAGLAGARGLTKDGFELAFGTNHLGHFLFTMRLMPKLIASAKDGGARIVNVSSKSHYDAKGIDWSVVRTSTPTPAGLREYEVSKLANVLFTRQLAKRVKEHGITTYSLHPGVVASDVWRNVPWPFRGIMKLFMITNEQGAMTQLYCATDPSLASMSGRYYDRCAEKQPSKIAEDEALELELWTRSEAWVAPFLT